MAHWLDNFRSRLQRHVSRFATAQAYQDDVDWAVQKHLAARRLLAPEAIENAAPRELYGALREVCLNVGALPFRATRIADANAVEQVRMGLCRLITTKGTAEDKMRAAALPQFGEATLTELLCVYAPHRFVMRNRATMGGIVRLCEVYSEPHLREMPYEDFADLTVELEKELRAALLAKLPMEDFYLSHKCLLVCLFLAQHAGKGKRPYA